MVFPVDITKQNVPANTAVSSDRLLGGHSDSQFFAISEINLPYTIVGSCL